MYLRHDGVNIIIRDPVEDVNEPRRDAPVALFNTNQSHAAVVRRRVHEDIIAHDGNTVAGPRDGGLKYVRRMGDGPAPAMSGGSAAWSSAPSG